MSAEFAAPQSKPKEKKSMRVNDVVLRAANRRQGGQMRLGFSSGIALAALIWSCGALAQRSEPAAPVVAKISSPADGDALNRALAAANWTRADVGLSPKGWWQRYPKPNRYRSDLFDGLSREPFASVPFARNLGKTVDYQLAPEQLAQRGRRGPGPNPGHSLSRLVHNVIAPRWYGGVFETYARSNLNERSGSVADALLKLYRDWDEPTKISNFQNKPYLPNPEQQIRTQASTLPPAVDAIIGRLILDIIDIRPSVDLAFRNVSLEDRLAIARRMDMGDLEAYNGLSYADVHRFDDVERQWDEGSLWFAAIQSTQALDDARLALQALPKGTLSALGALKFDWQTPLGWIRIRGSGSDDIDATDSLLIVDLGGDDRWTGPAGGSSPIRSLSLALDLAGNDSYKGDSATQGAGITGVGILMDSAGDDSYQAERYAQGIGQFGFGALIDLAGRDVYRSGTSSQGAGMFSGVGLLADAWGNDEYRLHANGQGYGGPGSVGILADRAGDDLYYADPRPKNSGRPSYDIDSSASSVQGVGAGFATGRTGGQSWAGGLGGLIDIAGADQYVAGTWSQGTGYWFGVGVLYDMVGSDTYKGGERWSQASSAHYGVGILVDDGGDDRHTLGASMGMAHDGGVALFLDGGGNDHYAASGFGFSRDRGVLGAFIETGGDDIYELAPYQGTLELEPGYALPDPAFKVDENGTGNVSDGAGRVTPYFAYMRSLGLFLDLDGRDSYSGAFTNGAARVDPPGSGNRNAGNIGIAMDLDGGRVDWGPAGTHLAGGKEP